MEIFIFIHNQESDILFIQWIDRNFGLPLYIKFIVRNGRKHQIGHRHFPISIKNFYAGMINKNTKPVDFTALKEKLKTIV